MHWRTMYKVYSLLFRYSDGVIFFNNLKTLLKFSCELNPDFSASASIEKFSRYPSSINLIAYSILYELINIGTLISENVLMLFLTNSFRIPVSTEILADV